MTKDGPTIDPVEGSPHTIESDFERAAGNGSGDTNIDEIRDAAGDRSRRALDRFQEVVETLGTTAGRVRAEDEEALVAAYAAGLGLTLGLLAAGSNRLIVLTALAPTAYLGAALFGRLRNRGGYGRWLGTSA